MLSKAPGTMRRTVGPSDPTLFRRLVDQILLRAPRIDLDKVLVKQHVEVVEPDGGLMLRAPVTTIMRSGTGGTLQPVDEILFDCAEVPLYVRLAVGLPRHRELETDLDASEVLLQLQGHE